MLSPRQIAAFFAIFGPLLGLMVYIVDGNSALARLVEVIAVAVGSVALSYFGFEFLGR